MTISIISRILKVMESSESNFSLIPPNIIKAHIGKKTCFYIINQLCYIVNFAVNNCFMILKSV